MREGLLSDSLLSDGSLYSFILLSAWLVHLLNDAYTSPKGVQMINRFCDPQQEFDCFSFEAAEVMR